MDGDIGRKLTKKNQPLTDHAKAVERRLANHPLTLQVLRRYGIENYLPRHAYEAALKRDLTRDLTNYFPIPPAKKIENHFCEPQSWWRRGLNCLRKRHPSFYRKTVNEQAAQLLTISDIDGTDLGEIVRNIKQRAEESRLY